MEPALSSAVDALWCRLFRRARRFVICAPPKFLYFVLLFSEDRKHTGCLARISGAPVKSSQQKVGVFPVWIQVASLLQELQGLGVIIVVVINFSQTEVGWGVAGINFEDFSEGLFRFIGCIGL